MELFIASNGALKPKVLWCMVLLPGGVVVTWISSCMNGIMLKHIHNISTFICVWIHVFSAYTCIHLLLSYITLLYPLRIFTLDTLHTTLYFLPLRWMYIIVIMPPIAYHQYHTIVSLQHHASPHHFMLLFNTFLVGHTVVWWYASMVWICSHFF